MMTNATVANAVKGVDGQTVTVTYKGGEKKIDIPANVPVVAVVPGSKADIVPGALVFVPTGPSIGWLLDAAVRFLFGKDGVIPHRCEHRDAMRLSTARMATSQIAALVAHGQFRPDQHQAASCILHIQNWVRLNQCGSSRCYLLLC